MAASPQQPAASAAHRLVEVPPGRARRGRSRSASCRGPGARPRGGRRRVGFWVKVRVAVLAAILAAVATADVAPRHRAVRPCPTAPHLIVIVVSPSLLHAAAAACSL